MHFNSLEIVCNQNSIKYTSFLSYSDPGPQKTNREQSEVLLMNWPATWLRRKILADIKTYKVRNSSSNRNQGKQWMIVKETNTDKPKIETRVI